MKRFLLCMPEELVVADDLGGAYRLQYMLRGMQPTCAAADPFASDRLYCGTDGQGLWVSDDGGDHWTSLQDGIPDGTITSVFVSPSRRNGRFGVVYAGTELSSVYVSEDGGSRWTECGDIRSLSSYAKWSFPPKPETHNVRTIAEDAARGGLYVAIEAGALIRMRDSGGEWIDTEPGHPLDAHALITHPKRPNRVHAACSDGVAVPGRSVLASLDGGNTWAPDSDGLEHRYLFGMAVDSHDPDILLVSASEDARAAYDHSAAHSVIYRKQGSRPWRKVQRGLPPAQGTMVANLAADPAEPGVFYALNNRGLYRSADSGITWNAMELEWKEEYIRQQPHRRHRSALLVLNKDSGGSR
ncbi:WD40/YVTN/BNR-like repeat-containing protein [Cohnella zeiphila]|uniref:Glycosyl hydrolase n=1 Tax=Cohnella zeiphila TaxID=2761120 RepID=A0A7X0VYW9_9BACL|nr:glycosyl hydrolase [Cohnella zeiphila]MBB6735426.1 glycosyl hydrolase [Cohnella zeiphila]